MDRTVPVGITLPRGLLVEARTLADGCHLSLSAWITALIRQQVHSVFGDPPAPHVRRDIFGERK